MRQDILKILDYAIWAPSGDNSQPWAFQINGDRLLIYNLPNKDNPYLNFKQSGSHIAHGGLIENIVIAAPHFGYFAEVLLFPSSPAHKDLVASISFDKSRTYKSDPLFTFIKERHTNRRPYENTPLTSEQRESILKTPEELGFGLFKLLESEGKKKIVGGAGALAEIVILENKMLHSYLFKDVVWTEKEEKEKRHGLYIKTMEFNPIQKILFRLASQRSLMKFAIQLGLPKFIAKEDSKLYATGSALGIVAMPDHTKYDAINAGRVIQRIWLKATAMGIALQPITATLFFGQRVLLGEDKDLISAHKDLIKRAYNDIKKEFDLNNETPYMMFRLGRAKPVSGRSSRISVHEKLSYSPMTL